jgi:methylmalonyl-CoA/ethylmalonyl-CoA epimerase
MALAEGIRMSFDHVSIAVESIDRAADFFGRYFPIELRNPKQPSEQPSGIFFWQDFHLGGGVIEFIEDPPGIEGFVTRFIRRYGEGLHHLSFETDQLDSVVSAFESNGVRIVDAEQFDDGNKTAFIAPRSAFGTLIQFWQLSQSNRSEARLSAAGVHFDHVAIAVRNIERAMRFFARYFPSRVINSPMLSHSSDFTLAHMDVAGFQIEFIQSNEGSARDDFVTRFIERYGEGLHHITVEMREFDATLAKLRADGVRVIGPEPNYRGGRQFYISPQSAFGTLVQVWDEAQLLLNE